jgi:hypothetical protein
MLIQVEKIYHNKGDWTTFDQKVYTSNHVNHQFEKQIGQIAVLLTR